MDEKVATRDVKEQEWQTIVAGEAIVVRPLPPVWPAWRVTPMWRATPLSSRDGGATRSVRYELLQTSPTTKKAQLERALGGDVRLAWAISRAMIPYCIDLTEPQRVRLYEIARAGGIVSATLRLAQLYLRGLSSVERSAAPDDRTSESDAERTSVATDTAASTDEAKTEVKTTTDAKSDGAVAIADERRYLEGVAVAEQYLAECAAHLGRRRRGKIKPRGDLAPVGICDAVEIAVAYDDEFGESDEIDARWLQARIQLRRGGVERPGVVDDDDSATRDLARRIRPCVARDDRERCLIAGREIVRQLVAAHPPSAHRHGVSPSLASAYLAMTQILEAHEMQTPTLRAHRRELLQAASASQQSPPPPSRDYARRRLAADAML